MESFYYGTGRRKSAVARVFLKPGTGNIQINKKDINDYFKRLAFVVEAKKPLTLLERLDEFDLYITVKGGGNTGQAGSICLGLARALVEMDNELKPTLKKAGLLTRDSRRVERKKYGMRGARARYQYSKR